MPFGDATPLVYALIAVIAALGVWIYIEDRRDNKKKFDSHELRLQSLELERTDIAVMKTDIRYIREAVDDVRGKKR